MHADIRLVGVLLPESFALPCQKASPELLLHLVFVYVAHGGAPALQLLRRPLAHTPPASLAQHVVMHSGELWVKGEVMSHCVLPANG